MRKDVTEDWTAVADVLDCAEYLSLALKDEAGLYSVPVNFAYADGMVYFHSARKGRKFEALRRAEAEETSVAFSAAADLEMKTGAKACQWGYKFRCVLGSGPVRLVESLEEKRAGLGAIMKKYAGADNFPYDENIFAKTAVVAIRVEKATARLKLD
ncbi:MAG: pyridoxamine 5'-phosphate oxidase family protein [Humidesulfovibrio sp.]|nr:pyridoxamine 5'-phosphate oxidase family protein [Humidesulfovibrio sp.]